jgi:hypothetical protein
MMKEHTMSTVTKEALQQLLEKCITLAVDEAQKEIADPLPAQFYLGLGAFGQLGKELSLDEVLSFLFRDGTFPRIVDIAVRGIKDGRTFIWIRPSGHAYVSDFAQTWNTPVGMGPFKSIGLMLPSFIWQRSRPLSTQDLREAGEKW